MRFVQQLEYQTKTKNLSSLSRELLHSLIVLEDDYFLKQIIGKTEFEEKLTTLLDGAFDECNEVGVSIGKMVDDVINELFSYNPSPVALRGHIQTLINNIRTILDEGPFTDEDEDEDDSEDCDDEDVAVKDPEWLWHKFNRIIHYDGFTLQNAVQGLECLTLKIHQQLNVVDDPIIRENLNNVVKSLKENHLTLQNLIDESREVALKNLLN